MAQVVVLGAGISGHTAALFLRKWLGKDHSVVVVSPSANYNWIPSNIWVGVGLLKPHQVMFCHCLSSRESGYGQRRGCAG